MVVSQPSMTNEDYILSHFARSKSNKKLLHPNKISTGIRIATQS